MFKKQSSLSRWLVLLFFFSGFSGLILEVLWVRMLKLVFGATTLSVSTVLTAFFAGLALGSLLLGRVADKSRKLLLIYAGLEIGVGIFALLVPTLFSVLDGIYTIGYQTLAPFPYGFNLIRFLLSFAVLLVPTTLMGGTLPVLSKVYARRGSELGWDLGVLYTSNTLGAVAGCFTAGFIFIENLGVYNTNLLAAMIDIFVGIIVFGLYRGGAASFRPHDAPLSSATYPPETAATPGRTGNLPAQASNRSFPLLLIFFGLSGFTALAYEVIWTRILVFFLGTRVYTFSIMLTTFLIGTALGSFIFARYVHRIQDKLLGFALLEIGIGLYTAFSLIFIYKNLDALMISLSVTLGEASFRSMIAILFLVAAQVILIPTLLFGATFPLVSALGHVPDKGLGGYIGDLYASNTFGGILGSFAAGFILIPALGIYRSLLCVAFVNLLIGAWALRVPQQDGKLSSRRSGRALKSCAGVGLLGLFLAGTLWSWNHPSPIFYAGHFHQPGTERKLLYYREGLTATVSVEDITRNQRTWRSLDINGVNVAGTSPMLVAIQKMQGHLPLLLHPNPKKILHIGFGSGGTAWSVSRHPIDRIDVVEISPEVLAANSYLQEVNHQVIQDPRLRVIINDGRNHIMASPERYDVILSDSIHPRYAGNASLYTTDYYRMCQQKLTDHGVISQWLPLYGLSEENFKMILKSFYTVFPNATVWYVNTTPNPYTLTIGMKNQAPIDVRRLEEKLREPETQKDLGEIHVTTLPQLLSFLLMGREGIARYISGVEEHTDDRPYIEFLAPKVLSSELSWVKNFKSILNAREHDLNYLLSGAPESDAWMQIRERVLREHDEILKGALGEHPSDGEEVPSPYR